jgi:hypothetical protein
MSSSLRSTGSSNITTGTINASNVTASGILNIAGYTDVKVAIDGKQPQLTGSSNITTGTINATNVTASGNITTGTIAATDITTSGTVVEWTGVCKQQRIGYHRITSGRQSMESSRR